MLLKLHFQKYTHVIYSRGTTFKRCKKTHREKSSFHPRMACRLWQMNNLYYSVQFSCSVMSGSVTLWTAACQASLPSPAPGVYSNSYPLSPWCHPTISSSVVPFSCCLQSFPATGSFQMSKLFASGGQSIGVSAATSVLPINTQDWSPLECTGWISLHSKGRSRVFSNTTVQKHQFFGAQLSL